MRLMVQGEARNQNSLFRLLTAYPGPDGRTLLDLFTSGTPSIMDIMLKGEESSEETSLARIMLGTTFTIENGQVVMGSMLGDISSKPSIYSRSSLPDNSDSEEKQKERIRKQLRKGMTIAKASMLGEEDGGPGISFMRVLLLGEEQGVSVLRLLLTGEKNGDVSPLRIIFTGLYTAFVAARAVESSSKELQRDGLYEIAKNPTKWKDAISKITQTVIQSVNETHQNTNSWKESFEKLIELGRKQVFQSTEAWQENVAFLWTAFARVRSMGPEFAKVWKKQWIVVGKEIRLTGERVRKESVWKNLAPHFADLCDSIADQQWQKVFLIVTQLIREIESAAGTKPNQSLSAALDIIEQFSSWAPNWF